MQMYGPRPVNYNRIIFRCVNFAVVVCGPSFLRLFPRPSLTNPSLHSTHQVQCQSSPPTERKNKSRSLYQSSRRNYHNNITKTPTQLFRLSTVNVEFGKPHYGGAPQTPFTPSLIGDRDKTRPLSHITIAVFVEPSPATSTPLPPCSFLCPLQLKLRPLIL
jgi:hypothetical protein